jgi:hypothetical protein
VRYDRDVRVVLLVCLLACKDQAQTEAPKPGPASAVVSNDASGFIGTPPVKTTKPIDAAKAQELAKRDFPSWGREVRNADDKGVDLLYMSETHPIVVIAVNASKCFDCLPMEESKWKAKSDALRYVIGPELKDHRDTTWEMGMTDIAGTPYAFTYHVAFDGAGAYSTAYAVYYNDGVNMIRVIASYGDAPPKSRDAMVAWATRQNLEQVAKGFMDEFVHAW